MSLFQGQDTLGDIVTRHPSLSRVLDKMGIDYCCGGKRTLSEVCQSKKLDLKELLVTLENSISTEDAPSVDVAAMSLTELADHIEQVHHTFMHSELPRLKDLIDKVVSAHGDKEPRLHQVKKTFLSLSNELSSHLEKEEQILFPMVRQLDASATTPETHCGSINNPISQMELEHDHAGSDLETLRKLTDRYAIPDWACNSYRALMDALTELESDLHQHIHKENNILFPRAIEMEKKKSP